MAAKDYYILLMDKGTPVVRKVRGQSFKVGDPPMIFYHTFFNEHNSRRRKYSVTIGDTGMFVGTFNKLSEAKKYCNDNIDKIRDKLEEKKIKQLTYEFKKLVEIEKNKQEMKDE